MPETGSYLRQKITEKYKINCAIHIPQIPMRDSTIQCLKWYKILFLGE
jgi:hypothetical protein